jgi:hypothetical protein
MSDLWPSEPIAYIVCGATALYIVRLIVREAGEAVKRMKGRT